MLANQSAMEAPELLASWFLSVRSDTEQICALLEIEDHVVQPAPFVSPPKWHLAHTSWFFDNFILAEDDSGCGSPDSALFNMLFNSYYKSQGPHWMQQHRGRLSRPTVATVLAYRDAVTSKVVDLLLGNRLDTRQRQLLTLGLHHEQQHQELLLMDIKYILGLSPDCPAYDAVSCPAPTPAADTARRWVPYAAGLVEIGAGDDKMFVFDNEGPRHKTWLDAFELSDGLVRNGEYLAFIEDGGYQRPELWLSDGWDWLTEQQIEAPLYWQRGADQALAVIGSNEWLEYHLGGLKVLDAALPVSHLSYYEADAYARWAQARLPSEQELELASRQEQTATAGEAFWQPGATVCPLPLRAADALENGLLWQWTRSAYTPYPGYAAESGALGEYNGKFMSNQLVLRGGSVATPRHHWRPSYRNFYRATDRWCFSGLRLARDCA